ncbi:MAG: hypothetical protein R3338_12370, partial [Thermoanaerobaculia bacterium]|nr:hypothetical protein [Thermoanaerobaculia bacterium]
MHPAIIAIVLLAAIFLSAGTLLWMNDRLVDRLRRDRRTPEQRAEEFARWRARLLNPRWDEVARLTGGAPSAPL